jgi:predicted small secreted protein
MKNMKLGQILRSAAKNSTLLVIALLSFQMIESKTPTRVNNNITRQESLSAQGSSTVVEDEGYKKTVIKRPLIAGEIIQESIRNNITRLPDGTILDITTKVEVILQDRIVITTIEELRKYDYEKALDAGTDAVVQLVDLAYQNREKIFDIFNKGRRAAAYALKDSLKDKGDSAHLQDALMANLLGQYFKG